METREAINYATAVIAFAATCLAIKGETWSPNKSGASRITFIGYLSFLLALICATLTIASTYLEKTEINKRRNTVIAELIRSINQNEMYFLAMRDPYNESNNIQNANSLIYQFTILKEKLLPYSNTDSQIIDPEVYSAINAIINHLNRSIQMLNRVAKGEEGNPDWKWLISRYSESVNNLSKIVCKSSFDNMFCTTKRNYLGYFVQEQPPRK